MTKKVLCETFNTEPWLDWLQNSPSPENNDDEILQNEIISMDYKIDMVKSALLETDFVEIVWRYAQS
jgi:hypothetical protein